MSIRIKTARPEFLLKAIKKKIKYKEITAWSYDADGDFTHTPTQWKYKAWLRPEIKRGELVLSIICPEGKEMAKETYSVYHGSFIETLLTYFDHLLEFCMATAHKSDRDHY
jgi:hypothetical protein